MRNETVTVTFSDGVEWRFKGRLADILRAKYDASRKPSGSIDSIRQTLSEIQDIIDEAASKSRPAQSHTDKG